MLCFNTRDNTTPWFEVFTRLLQKFTYQLRLMHVLLIFPNEAKCSEVSLSRAVWDYRWLKHIIGDLRTIQKGKVVSNSNWYHLSVSDKTRVHQPTAVAVVPIFEFKIQKINLAATSAEDLRYKKDASSTLPVPNPTPTNPAHDSDHWAKQGQTIYLTNHISC